MLVGSQLPTNIILAMKSTVFLFTFFVLCTIKSIAIPTDGRIRTISQKDGCLLHVRQCGDEFFHFYLSLDSIFLLSDENDNWYYATYTDGDLYPTRVIAHDKEERTPVEDHFLELNSNELYLSHNFDNIYLKWKTETETANVRRNVHRSKAIERHVFEGKRKGLVILVNFENRKMVSETALHDFSCMFNEHGYSKNNHVGSVSDYFKDQSYGRFDIEFDIVGPVELPNTYGYYGTNGIGGGGGHDKRAHEMIYDACKLADSNVNFADYDWDGDGVIEQVFVIYAGFGEATGGPANTIWPHESVLHYYYDNGINLDGVSIDRYACSNELCYYTNSVMGIGTACHEFSHCLGLPDLYDTDYSGAFGMSYWGIMNSGSYNGPNGIGEVPVGYTSFERWYLGWMDLTNVSSTMRVDGMDNIGKHPIAFRINNDINENEFYTLEYRNDDKWFSYVRNFPNPHGLLITHIDYDLTAWKSNNVNPSPSHQRMSIIPADNSFGDTQLELFGDLFPGSSDVKILGDNTHLATGGKLFNPNSGGTYEMGVSINQITENDDGTVSFNVIYNNDLYAPKLKEVTKYSDTSFTIEWEPVDSSDSYSLEIKWLISKKPFIEENVCVDNIREPFYEFKRTNCNEYKFRIRSCKNDILTEWSEYAGFNFDKTSVLEQVVNNNFDTHAYNVQGIMLENSFLPGFYIIKKGNNRKKNLKRVDSNINK